MTTISAERDLVTLVNVFTVRPEKQQRLVEVLLETASIMNGIHGYVSSNVHKSLDGTNVVNYVQWESVEDFRRPRTYKWSPGSPRSTSGTSTGSRSWTRPRTRSRSRQTVKR